jgi:hypothetical protein
MTLGCAPSSATDGAEGEVVPCGADARDGPAAPDAVASGAGALDGPVAEEVGSLSTRPLKRPRSLKLFRPWGTRCQRVPNAPQMGHVLGLRPRTRVEQVPRQTPTQRVALLKVRRATR